MYIYIYAYIYIYIYICIYMMYIYACTHEERDALSAITLMAFTA